MVILLWILLETYETLEHGGTWQSTYQEDEEIGTLTQDRDLLGHGNVFGRFCQAKEARYGEVNLKKLDLWE